MRITGEDGPGIVWDAESGSILHDVMMVDDVEMVWEQAEQPLRVEHDQLVTRIHHVRKIVIDMDRRIVVINPPDGFDMASVRIPS